MKYIIKNNKIKRINISGIIIKGSIDKINKERRTFSGWGSVSIIDRQGDFIDMKEFYPVMEKLIARGAPVTDSHSNHVVGKIIDYQFRPTKDGHDGLYLTAEIYNHYPSDEETWHKIQDGEYTGFSLGGKAGTKTPTCTNVGCYNILGDIEAWEFSIVERPANQLANIDKVNKLAKASDVVDEIIYTITKDGHITQKSFANYKDFEQCVAENKDKGDPDAYCGAIKHKVEKESNDIREKLSELEHNQWIEWSKNIAETEEITPERLFRWKKLWIPYNELSEEDKNKDREWADKVLKIIKFDKSDIIKTSNFTLDDVKRIGDQLNIDWSKIDQNEFLIGLNLELEHGTKFPETNVTDDDEIATAKIALAHLNEYPDYYNEGNGLPEMEKRLKSIKKGKIYVDNPSDAPKDKKVKEGKRGGLYYESEGQKQTTPKPKLSMTEYFKRISELTGTKVKMGNPITRALYEGYSIDAGHWLTTEEFENELKLRQKNIFK